MAKVWTRPLLERFCFKCGLSMQVKTNRRKYCSDQCRKAAWAEVHRPPVDKSKTTLKRWMTKHDHVTNVTCPACDKGFFVDGNTANRVYHDDACQQKAYRERKKHGAVNQAFKVNPDQPALPGM